MEALKGYTSGALIIHPAIKFAESLKGIAKKYAGKPDAEAKILTQITTGAKVKLEDGSEDEHKIVKSKDKAELSNMIQWILSLK